MLLDAPAGARVAPEQPSSPAVCPFTSGEPLRRKAQGRRQLTRKKSDPSTRAEAAALFADETGLQVDDHNVRVVASVDRWFELENARVTSDCLREPLALALAEESGWGLQSRQSLPVSTYLDRHARIQCALEHATRAWVLLEDIGNLPADADEELATAQRGLAFAKRGLAKLSDRFPESQHVRSQSKARGVRPRIFFQSAVGRLRLIPAPKTGTGLTWRQITLALKAVGVFSMREPVADCIETLRNSYRAARVASARRRPH